MNIETSTTPAEMAGAHISRLIAEAQSDCIVLLSGGSALDVFEFLNISKQSECRTIFIMGDERVTGEVDVNNFLQLQERYADHPLIELVLDTRGLENETPENFATRIKNIFTEKLSELTEPKIFTLLGVGPDGHTAGIFPMEEESFRETYQADLTYVPVHLESLTIDSRASFTPSWILESSDALIGFVAGESKKEILNELIDESKPIHEQPAQLLKKHAQSTVYTDLDIS